MKTYYYYQNMIIFLRLIILNSTLSESIGNCTSDLRQINNYTLKIDNSFCANKTCISKCCYRNQVFFYDELDVPATGCHDVSHIATLSNETYNFDYSDLLVYKVNEYNDIVPAGRNIKESVQQVFDLTFYYKPGECLDTFIVPWESSKLQMYILEDGTLLSHWPNHYNRFEISSGRFCMEYLVKRYSSGQVTAAIAFRKAKVKIEAKKTCHPENYEKILAGGYLVSSFFLIVMLVVYGSLKDLRNINGMVLMAYAGTLLVAFICKASQFLLNVQNKELVCKKLGVVVYFLLMSSFSWMFVMSLDIWWTFRGMAKSTMIHRRGELTKFIVYGLCAWGLPLLMTIIVAVIDNLDLIDSPAIVKPHFETCFYISAELRIYVYAPILFLLICNWTFFVWTGIIVYQTKKGLTKFHRDDQKKCTNNEIRFMLYLKLSVVMGLSWTLEVFPLPCWMDFIADPYNCLIGVFIFFIFVFKKKIFVKLCARYNVQNHYLRNLERKWSTVNIPNRSSTAKKSSIAVSETSDVTPSTTTSIQICE